MAKKKRTKKKGGISFNAPRQGGGVGTINRNYLVSTWIKRLETQQTNARQSATLPNLIARRDRLIYDEEALKLFEEHEGRDASRKYRKDEHDRRTTALANWEDFLFYQNSLHRWERLNILKPREKRKPPVAGAKRRSWMFPHDEENEFVRKMLDHYDERGVGDEGYRSGLKDATGEILNDDEDPDGVGPDELHLWTPRPSRVPSGLPHIVNGIVVPRPTRAYDLVLDDAAIETRRAEVESKQCEPVNRGETLSYATHSARREAERSRYRGEVFAERPSTSNLRKLRGEVFEESFQHIRTTQGLFIAANETSRDWLTSYDCLGFLDQNWTANVLSSGSNGGGDDKDRGDSTGGAAKGSIVRPAAKSDKVIEGTDVPSDGSDYEELKFFLPPEPKKNKSNADEEVAQEAKKSKSKRVLKPEDEDQARKRRADARSKRKASQAKGYEYNYDGLEFTKDPRPLKSYDRFLHPMRETVIEATNGRRERHVDLCIQDSSPPTSPPRALMPRDAQLESVPDGVDDEDLPDAAYTRCEHGMADCRAWWTHAPENCWRAILGPMTGPEEQRIDGTAEGSEHSHQLLPIARSCREVYRDRLRDHYGRLHPGSNADWPAFGIRVPYEPMTVLDDRRQRRRAKAAGLEADVTAVVSMAFPIILESQRGFGERQKAPPEMPPHMGGSGNTGNSGGSSDDDESDDEGDLFRKSYLQGSDSPREDPASGRPEEPTDPTASD